MEVAVLGAAIAAEAEVTGAEITAEVAVSGAVTLVAVDLEEEVEEVEVVLDSVLIVVLEEPEILPGVIIAYIDGSKEHV